MAKKLSKKKKIIIGITTPLAALLLAFCMLCVVTLCMYPPAFLGRVLTHWDSDVTDFEIFPERVIEKSDTPYRYRENIRSDLGNLTINGLKKQKSLGKFIESTDTTSFIIVKDDEVVYEQYANGYDKNSVNTSFSMAKSVVSLLIGKAIENGFIGSVKRPDCKLYRRI